jgi:hypothetical protein
MVEEVAGGMLIAIVPVIEIIRFLSSLGTKMSACACIIIMSQLFRTEAGGFNWFLINLLCKIPCRPVNEVSQTKTFKGAGT